MLASYFVWNLNMYLNLTSRAATTTYRFFGEAKAVFEYLKENDREVTATAHV
jgi:hypothetical protein